MLFRSLLEKFQLALEVLYELEDPHEKAFKDTVDGIMQVGDALQTMVGGSIIEVHMKVITIAHDKSCHITRDVNEETESEETEQDEELYKISSMLPTWQAYYEWLKLMVVHFDAMRILISFRERVRKPFTIKVISTPQPDKSLMPWKKLLENERYFHNRLLPTSTIIAFLEEWWDGQKTGNPHIKAVISDWCSLKPDRSWTWNLIA